MFGRLHNHGDHYSYFGYLDWVGTLNHDLFVYPNILLATNVTSKQFRDSVKQIDVGQLMVYFIGVICTLLCQMSNWAVEGLVDIMIIMTNTVFRYLSWVGYLEL